MVDHKLIDQLNSSIAEKRESAAKKIGKSKDPHYGPFLVSALKKRIKRPTNMENSISADTFIGVLQLL